MCWCASLGEILSTLGFPRGHRTPSLATPVPPSSLQATPDIAVLLSLRQSGVQHLSYPPVLGLIRARARCH